MPRQVKGRYVDTVQVHHPDTGGLVDLHVWQNPETGRLFALNNMDVAARKNYANDPYEDGVAILFENTFTGLPK